MPDKSQAKLGERIVDNIVPIIFLFVTLLGLFLSPGDSTVFLMSELSARFFRNAFLVLSLIIPVLAGLGLNFGIVVGAAAGQIAIIIVRYFYIGGLGGFFLTLLIATPIAALCGYLTGRLYNRTKGQEMISSMIVGFFSDGVYQFLFLFVIGFVIPVSATNPLIRPTGTGIRATVDLVPTEKGGLTYALDAVLRVPLVWAALVVGLALLAYFFVRYMKKKISLRSLLVNGGISLAVALAGLAAILTGSELVSIQLPVLTGLMIALLGIFIILIMRTKLGQDFRSVGHSQHIAAASGINVDRTRIIAVIISTVLAAWGQVIFLQNMGTMNTFGAHKQIGMFSVAALLVGGASISKATVKQALVGTLLFNAMFIMSPEIGKALFGQVLLGEYFRTFMVYGVIGLALGLYAWRGNKKQKIKF